MLIINHLNFEKAYEPGVGYRLRLKDNYQFKFKKYMIIFFKISNSKDQIYPDVQQMENNINQLEFNYFQNDNLVGFAYCPITLEVINYVNMGQSFNLSNKSMEIVLFGDNLIIASLRPNTAENLKSTIVDIIKKNDPNYSYKSTIGLKPNTSYNNTQNLIKGSFFNRNILPPLQSSNIFPSQIRQMQKNLSSHIIMEKLAGPNAEEEIAPEINEAYKISKDRLWLTENYR